MDFAGKVAIVTGASSGIGAATAVLLATHGARVALVGRNERRLHATAAKCEAARGLQMLSVIADLLHDGSCETVVKKTVETFGRIDVLVNCAGKAILTSLFEDSMEAYDELFKLNLRVPYLLTQLALPHLVKTKGNIVNVIGAAMRTKPGFLPYAMARDALERFSKSGAVELAAEGVRMNSVRPGITRTNFLSNFNIDEDVMESTYAYLAKDLPHKRIIEPEEIARMIVFVASDTCPNLNGTNLDVDGAASMAC